MNTRKQFICAICWRGAPDGDLDRGHCHPADPELLLCDHCYDKYMRELCERADAAVFSTDERY